MFYQDLQLIAISNSWAISKLFKVPLHAVIAVVYACVTITQHICNNLYFSHCLVSLNGSFKWKNSSFFFQEHFMKTS